MSNFTISKVERLTKTQIIFTENLKPGDKVLVCGGGMRRSSISKVERLTKTQIIIDGGYRFKRSDGCLAGRTIWGPMFISEVKVEDVEQFTASNGDKS